jgi:hypothetical protein
MSKVVPLLLVVSFLLTACVDQDMGPQQCGECEYPESGECLQAACCSDSDCGEGERCKYPGTEHARCATGRSTQQQQEEEEEEDPEECEPCQYEFRGECVHYICCFDEDCDDEDEDTIDNCLNPGTRQAMCSNRGISCGECQYVEDGECMDYPCCYDYQCDDNNPDTVDECKNPGSKNAACRRTNKGESCGNGVVESWENFMSCCQDAGCEEGYNCENNVCVPRETCGNGAVDPGENFMSCCQDAGCQVGWVCENNVCVETCGNGQADPGETRENCCADLGCQIGYYCEENSCHPYCGNGQVDSGETRETCCLDVPCAEGWSCVDNECTFVEAVCGNGIPEEGETRNSCCLDTGCCTWEECQGASCTWDKYTYPYPYHDSGTSVLYLTNPGCSYCKAMDAVLRSLAYKGYRVQHRTSWSSEFQGCGIYGVPALCSTIDDDALMGVYSESYTRAWLDDHGGPMYDPC